MMDILLDEIPIAKHSSKKSKLESLVDSIRCEIFDQIIWKYFEIVTTLKGKIAFSYSQPVLDSVLDHPILDPFLQILGKEKLFIYTGFIGGGRSISYEIKDGKLTPGSLLQIEHAF